VKPFTVQRSPFTAIAFGLLAVSEPIAPQDVSTDDGQRSTVNGNLEEVSS
jgi:hypothetical protein